MLLTASYEPGCRWAAAVVLPAASLAAAAIVKVDAVSTGVSAAVFRHVWHPCALLPAWRSLPVRLALVQMHVPPRANPLADWGVVCCC